MRPVWILALNTYREVIRDRVLYALLLFAVLLIGFSLALGQLSFAEQGRISADFGLGAIHLAAAALAVFVGSNLVYKEIEKKTILTILVRPIGRGQFILGKALGLTLLIVTMVGGLAAVLALIFRALGLAVDQRFAAALLGVLGEAWVLLGFTLLFSMFTKPLLVVCFSIGIFLIGHWQSSLEFFVRKDPGGALGPIAWMTRHFLPDLEKLNWKDLVLYAQPLDWPNRAAAMGYAAGWFATCLALAAILFRKKDVG